MKIKAQTVDVLQAQIFIPNGTTSLDSDGNTLLHLFASQTI